MRTPHDYRTWAVADAVRGLKPRQWHSLPPALRLSGMEAASFF